MKFHEILTKTEGDNKELEFYSKPPFSKTQPLIGKPGKRHWCNIVRNFIYEVSSNPVRVVEKWLWTDGQTICLPFGEHKKRYDNFNKI